MLKWLMNSWKSETQGNDPYYQGKIIGRPQATDSFTVEELEAKDVVGVYTVTHDEPAALEQK